MCVCVCVCVVQQCCSDVCFSNVVATSIYQQRSDVGGQCCPDYSKKQQCSKVGFQRHSNDMSNPITTLFHCWIVAWALASIENNLLCSFINIAYCLFR